MPPRAARIRCLGELTRPLTMPQGRTMLRGRIRRETPALVMQLGGRSATPGPRRVAIKAPPRSTSVPRPKY